MAYGKVKAGVPKAFNKKKLEPMSLRINILFTTPTFIVIVL